MKPDEFSRTSAQLALGLTCVCMVWGCEPKSGVESAHTTAQQESVAPELLWQASMVEVVGESVIKIKPKGADAFLPFASGQILAPGDTISTGTHAQVTLKVTPGDGEIFLDHLSEATILSSAPGIALHRGHALVTSPHFEHGEKPEGYAPQVILPTGKVTLTGTRISAHATPEEGRITVSQGEVTAVGASGEKVVAGFGQEIVLRDAQPARVLHAPDIGQAFSWSEAVTQRDETLPELERGMGKLVARRPYSEVEQALELRDHSIQVRIQGMMAYTEITEEFHNPGSDNLEGLYRFPLPPDAQISRLSLLVGNRWMEGQFLENARAERIWRQITTEPRVQPRDPALLQWKQGNQFELRIFPIPPRSSRKIKIGYVQKLQPTGDGYRYTYPMPVDRSGQSHATRFAFNATVQGIDDQHPVTLENYTGHEITEKRAGMTALSFERRDFRPSGDLGLRFMIPQDQKEMRSYTFVDPKKPDEDAYVALSIRPQFETQKTPDGRDFVVVLDRSYGRKGAAMAIQRALATQLVREMDPADRVRVIACASRCESIGSKKFASADASLVAELEPALDALDARGSTYAIEAMRSAARLFAHRDAATQARPAHVIYMTDGVISAGPAHPSTIERATQKVFESQRPKLSVISFGGDEDRANLLALSSAIDGDVLDLKPGSSMIAGALEILRHHYTAPLEQIAVQWPVGVEQVYPEKGGRLMPGEELTLVARHGEQIAQDTIKVRGVQNGQVREFEYALDLNKSKSSKGNAFVPRLWAKHRIDALEMTDGDVRKEIVALSQKFGILTRYTSLLALENERMMREFNVSHQRHIDWLGDEAPEEETATRKTGDLRDAFGSKGLPGAMSGEGGDLVVGRGAGGMGLRGAASGAEGFGRVGKSSKEDRNKAISADPVATGSIESLLAGDEPRAPEQQKADYKELESDDSWDDFDESEPVTATKTPRKKGKRASKPKSRPQDGLFASVDGESASSTKRRRSRRHCRKTHYFKTEDASSPTNYYIKRSERARRALADDPTNRTKYMDAIRRAMKLGPQGQDYAERTITSWLEINDMDPEALVLRGQVALNEGDLVEAKRWLFSAPDAAARAPWLLERVRNASRIFNDGPMTCAYEQTLADTKPQRDANQDVMECGPSTSADMLLDGVPAEVHARKIRDDKNPGPRADLRITATWSGPEALHIVLVEPTGRLLSAMSTRQKLFVYDEPGTQTLALPRLRAGSYDIRIVRENPLGLSLPVDLEIRLNGKTTRKQVTLGGLSQEVAQITRKSRRTCY